MATILNDKEIKKLIDSGIIINGLKENVQANSYVATLGDSGEFLNFDDEGFELDGNKKVGIRVDPGHCVGVISNEILNLEKEVVQELYPKCAIHAIITPTTSLMREGIVASSTQVDAGFYGTLNWTLTNTSSITRKYQLGTKIFRITFFKLHKKEEVPEEFYDGEYNRETGYVRSQRVSTHEGIKETQWEHPLKNEDEELERLSHSLYPWNIFGSKLKQIADQQKHMTTEWMLRLWSTILIIATVIIGVSTSDRILHFIKSYPIPVMGIAAFLALILWWQARSSSSFFKK